MTEIRKISNWKEEIKYSADGPQHVVLIDTSSYRAVLVGLEAGNKIPSHPSSNATYHFLEGSGWMIVDGERNPIEAGSTLVVPAGVERGIEAETRLAFLGSHGGHEGEAGHGGHSSHSAQKPSRRSLVMFSLMTFFMLLVMVGLMQIFASPMAMMLPSFGNMGTGVWGAMLVPMLGLLGMGVMMFFMYRMMINRTDMAGNGMDPAKHMVMMTKRQKDPKKAIDLSLETATYTIPAISCGGSKTTIERKVSELEGVSSVDVDVGSKKTVMRYQPPATNEKIELLLEKIGYPARVA